MFRHILLPVNLSGRTSQAVDMVRDLARSAPARATLLHVIETVSSAEYEEFASFYEELEARTARHLGELALRLEAPDLEVVRSVLNGKPAEEILRFAVDEEVDLIVLASHRLDPSKPGYGWSTLSYTGLGSRTMSGAAGQMRTGSGETHA